MASADDPAMALKKAQAKFEAALVKLNALKEAAEKRAWQDAQDARIDSELGKTPDPDEAGGEFDSVADSAPAEESEGSVDDVLNEIRSRLPNSQDGAEARMAAFRELPHEDLATLVYGLDRWAVGMSRQWRLASGVIWQLLDVISDLTKGDLPVITKRSHVTCSRLTPTVPFRFVDPSESAEEVAPLAEDDEGGEEEELDVEEDVEEEGSELEDYDEDGAEIDPERGNDPDGGTEAEDEG